MNVLEDIRPGTIYFGDCLEVMAAWRPEQVDLVYLDPPFNSSRNYNILFGTQSNGSSSQFLAFEDTWAWDDGARERVDELRGAAGHPARAAIAGLSTILGKSGMLSYVSYMAERLYHIHRILKPTGSLYLHCDATASHYLKILLDAVFGADGFRNEIVWQYGLGGSSKRTWSKKHDIILFYTKSPDYYFNKPTIPATSQRMKGRSKGMLDCWSDIPSLNNMSKERLGYPTQKPVALLERIIAASSRKGDLVLDPFCGCGTSLVAAHNTGRRWAGIDISAFAVETVMKQRLHRYGVTAVTDGVPADLASARLLARRSPFKFEAWAINQVAGMAPHAKQTGDEGVDGRGTLLHAPEGLGHRGVVAQVKSGKRISMDSVRAFRGIVAEDSHRAAAGVFITLDRNWTRGMEAEFAALGRFREPGAASSFPRLQFWSLEDFYRNGALPKLPSLTDPITGKPMHRTLWEETK